MLHIIFMAGKNLFLSYSNINYFFALSTFSVSLCPLEKHVKPELYSPGYTIKPLGFVILLIILVFHPYWDRGACVRLHLKDENLGTDIGNLLSSLLPT